MSYFRKPKTQKERREDQAFLSDEPTVDVPIKGRVRSGKSGGSLPSECSDKVPSSRRDRSKGKTNYSAQRKAKAKARVQRDI